MGAVRIRQLTTLACLVLVAVSGCSHAEGGYASPNAFDAASDTGRSDDRTILTAVQQRLASELGPAATAIHVEVRGGSVTLSGEIADDREHDRAEKIIYRVDGVERVDNRLRVKRPPVNPRAM